MNVDIIQYYEILLICFIRICLRRPRETELDEPIEMREDNNTNMHRAYRTPSERKAQEKLFDSLMPKKKVDTSLR